MKKKLVCFLLCVCMLAGTFLMTGCTTAGDADGSNAEGTTGDASNHVRSSMTLSLWVPTSEDTTEEALYAVEEAINQITQPEYETAVKLYAIPDSQYDQVVKDRLALLETRIKESEQKAIEERKKQIEAAKRGEAYVAETTEYENPNMDLSLIHI